MSSNIRFADRCDEKNKALKAILPEFVLCLRDFSLRLYVEGKGKLTEDDYLKDCLQHQKEMDESYNKPRECIRDFFSSRKCFTMPVPGDDEILENLETLEFDQLSKRFQEATVRFVSYIYSKDPKELIVSKPVNGKMFEVLTTQYVEALKHGAVPDVDDAFTAVAKIENARVAAEALEIFESQIKSVKLPIPTATLRDLYKNAQQQALDFLNPKVVHDGKNTCKNEAKMKMDNIWEEKKEENTKKLHDLCEITIKQKNEAILEPNIKNNAYNKAGGFRHYKRDIERMREEYVHALNDFDEHEVLGSWLEFVQQKRDIENIIIGTDDALTEKQKQEEKQQNKQMIEKLTKEQDEKYKAELQKQKKELEDQHKKIQADQKAQNDKDNERLEKLLNRINYLEEEDKKRKVKLENLEEEDKKRKEKLENLEEEDKERKEKIHRLEEEDRKRKAKGFIGRMWSAIAGE
ncbi:guanylate-binding protein 2-like [Mercenaria mercenaria]|uniref:guanylate-binding protein 2-like n=1 Tax=Mercenaria mercenaria TaxID=6596 RepID=UPI00234FAD01|nr:guanylate-binding protein 2-like [Mercenaria mercenaria]